MVFSVVLKKQFHNASCIFYCNFLKIAGRPLQLSTMDGFKLGQLCLPISHALFFTLLVVVVTLHCLL